MKTSKIFTACCILLFSLAHCSKKDPIKVGNKTPEQNNRIDTSKPPKPNANAARGGRQVPVANVPNNSTDENGFKRELVANKVALTGSLYEKLTALFHSEQYYGARGGDAAFAGFLSNICIQVIKYSGMSESTVAVFGIEIHNTACPEGITKMATLALWFQESFHSEVENVQTYSLWAWAGSPTETQRAVGKYQFDFDTSRAVLTDLCSGEMRSACSFDLGSDDKSINKDSFYYGGPLMNWAAFFLPRTTATGPSRLKQ